MANYSLQYRSASSREFLRHSLILALLLLTVSILQVSLLPQIKLLGVMPDLMLCTVLCVSFFCGEHTGAVAGILGGFLIWALGETGVTLLPLSYMLLGFLVGHYAKNIPEKMILNYLPYLGAALLLRMGLTTVYAVLTYSTLKPLLLLVRTLLPELLLTSIAGVASYYPLRLFCSLLRTRKKR